MTEGALVDEKDRQRYSSAHEINAGTLGQCGGVPGLRLSADQIDHFSETAPWKPRWRSVLPESRRGKVALTAVAAALAAAVALFLIELFQVW